MSNKTDLDWLARNVHEWCDGANYVCVNHTDGGHVFHEHNRNCAIWFTKHQWLARRAELQNKPGWDHEAVPAWATALAQDQDGEWKWLGDNVTQYVDGFTADKIRAQCKGVVLGSWRDTLEKRPEEFKLFTSIEDNQEQEMKHDNGWFERGELPPVGVECEIKRIYGRWCKAVTVGKDSGGRMVCELNDNGVFYASTSSAESFRPIRTEREELEILLRSTALSSFDDLDIIAGAIIAAGFRKEKK